jgi:nicotinate-nucleotide pyrophosphorylase (carboxylating)
VSIRASETEAQELRDAFAAAAALALEEDLGSGEFEADATTDAVVPETVWGAATLYAKQAGVICGLGALRATFAQLDARVTVALLRDEGAEVPEGEAVATVEGPVRAILIGERAALNVIGHLSGVASMVRAFVRAAPGVELTDTRKTLPGLRTLQKYAVRCGGGSNHRFSLWDGVLIKDNHIVAAGGVGEAVRRARSRSALPVQVECTSAADVDEALEAGAPSILLDNQTTEGLRALVGRIKERREHVLVEASGGVTLDNVAEAAATGVDRISVGAFTHSAPALDVSLKLERTWEES